MASNVPNWSDRTYGSRMISFTAAALLGHDLIV
jgi:hypothetical protein